MPNNQSVVDYKPINQSAIDTKSKNYLVTIPTQVYIDTVVIPGGQWIPFAGFTYPQAITVQQTRM